MRSRPSFSSSPNVAVVLTHWRQLHFVCQLNFFTLQSLCPSGISKLPRIRPPRTKNSTPAIFIRYLHKSKTDAGNEKSRRQDARRKKHKTRTAARPRSKKREKKQSQEKEPEQAQTQAREQAREQEQKSEARASTSVRQLPYLKHAYLTLENAHRLAVTGVGGGSAELV